MSSIRALLTEAPEEVTLTKEPVAAAPTPVGEKMSDTDFAPAPQPAAGGAPGLGAIPAINTGAAASATVQKTVMNSANLLPHINFLKNMVTTFEKAVSGHDLSEEDGKAYVHTFLTNLATSADQIASVFGLQVEGDGLNEEPPIAGPSSDDLGIQGGGEPMMPEMPMEPEPVQTGEMDLGAEPPIGGSPSPELSEPVPFEPSPFTDPSGAI